VVLPQGVGPLAEVQGGQVILSSASGWFKITNGHRKFGLRSCYRSDVSERRQHSIRITPNPLSNLTSEYKINRVIYSLINLAFSQNSNAQLRRTHQSAGLTAALAVIAVFEHIRARKNSTSASIARRLPASCWNTSASPSVSAHHVVRHDRTHTYTGALACPFYGLRRSR